ncbi:MAG: hypothetical protein ABI547_12605 [Betaproteobacteria bacterium]
MKQTILNAFIVIMLTAGVAAAPTVLAQGSPGYDQLMKEPAATAMKK